MGSATLGERVEHLEIATTELGRQVERVASEQAHLDKMLSLRFGTVDTGIAGINVRLDAMSTAIAMAGGDAGATPSGRALLGDIASGKVDRAESNVEITKLAARIGVLEQRMWLTQGAVGIAVVLLTLFGSTIRSALGLP